MIRRAASLSPRTANAEARSVEVVASTGASVRRYGRRPDDSFGLWSERLSIEGADLTRFAGASVLADHIATVDNVLGVVAAARIEASQLVAELRLAESAQRAFDLIRGGFLRQVSIGYGVDEWQREGGTVEEPVFVATRWQPVELSFVAIGADPGAVTRSMEDHPLSEPTNPPAKNPPTPAVEAAIVAERERANDIRMRVRAARLEESFADDLVNRGLSDDDTTTLIMQRMAERNPPRIRHHMPDLPSSAYEAVTGRRRSRLEGGYSNDDPANLRSRMVDALVARTTGKAPSAEAREYMGTSLLDMARRLFEARGERTSHLSRDQLYQRAMHTTSDFPQLLTATGDRVLLPAYEAAASPLKMLARSRTAADFRQLYSLRLGEAPRLLEVVEGGEVTQGTRSELKESYRIKTFGRIFTLTRQAIINDDLNAFGDWTQAMGQAAASTEADELAALLSANSYAGVNLDDGNPIFTTDRGNKASAGTSISVAGLSNARQAMRETKGLDGVTPLNLVPTFVLVGPSNETAAERAISVVYADEEFAVNVFTGRLQVAVEPRFTGGAWWVFADPGRAPVLEYANLADAMGPQFMSREGFDVLGMELRVTLDFGCGAVGWRGAYLNGGGGS